MKKSSVGAASGQIFELILNHTNNILALTQTQMISTKFKYLNLHIGDVVKVKSTIVEAGKKRVQSFQGILIAISGRGENQTITLRHIGPGGIGVERIWPINSRSLVDIEVVKKAKKVRRAKLYYLRNLAGRMATRV